MSLSVLWLAFGAQPFRARDARDALGVTKASSSLSRYVQEGVLERVGRGTYRFSAAPKTQAIAARLLEIERDRQAELFPALAGERMASWRATGWFTRIGDGRYRLRLPGRTAVVRRVA